MILIKLLYTVLFIVSFNKLVECRSYNNGLIFYNLENHKSYLPPTISVSRGRGLSNIKYSSRGSIWSTFGKPCDCKGPLCGCCVGIKVKQYNFVEKMCANVSYFLPRDEIQLEVFLNDTSTAKYGIAARNPSPLCVPIMMGIPMSMCIQMSNIGVQGDNLNMCMDFLVRLASTELFEMHFQCMKVGLQGASWVGTDGQPVIPANEGKLKDKTTHESDEYYDESQEGDQENEINFSKEKGNENIAANIQEEEEEMDNNDITEKIMDIVKIKEQQQVVQESNAAIENNDYKNRIPTLDHKQVGQIVTNIMDSINEGNAAEEIDTLMTTAVKKDASYSVENGSQVKDFLSEMETVDLENAKTEKNYTSKNETSENVVESLGESATMKYDNKIIETAADSEVLFNKTTLKDELHLEEFLEYPQQQEEAFFTTELNSSVNGMPLKEIEKQQEEFYNINLEQDPEELISNTDNILNNLEKIVSSTEYSMVAILRPTESQKTTDTSEIGKTNTKNKVITTETIMLRTTTNKPLKADINPAVIIPAKENSNDISSNKNKNAEKEEEEDEEQNKDNANCDDDDDDEDEDDNDEYDDDDDDDSHENDSDESAEAEDDADDETTENNDSISNYIPTSLKLNQRDFVTTQDQMNEPNSDEKSASNKETYDQLVFEEEEYKLNDEKQHHHNKLNALFENNGEKSYEIAGMNMKDLKHKNENKKQSSKSTSPSSLRNKDPHNNKVEIPQIVTASNNNLQFANNINNDTKNNFMLNSTDGVGEREVLNIKSTENKMSQMSISNATSRNVMPLPLARNLLSLYHHHPHHQQQHSRHHSRQRLFYV